MMVLYCCYIDSIVDYLIIVAHYLIVGIVPLHHQFSYTSHYPSITPPTIPCSATPSSVAISGPPTPTTTSESASSVVSSFSSPSTLGSVREGVQGEIQAHQSHRRHQGPPSRKRVLQHIRPVERSQLHETVQPCQCAALLLLLLRPGPTLDHLSLHGKGIPSANPPSPPGDSSRRRRTRRSRTSLVSSRNPSSPPS